MSTNNQGNLSVHQFRLPFLYCGCELDLSMIFALLSESWAPFQLQMVQNRTGILELISKALSATTHQQKRWLIWCVFLGLLSGAEEPCRIWYLKNRKAKYSCDYRFQWRTYFVQMLHPLRIEFKNKNWIKLTTATATKYKLYRAMTNCNNLFLLTSALYYFYKLRSTYYGVRLRKRKDAVIV